ncbi:Hsp20/alpha crystallin family protein [Halovivax limisalsi]|uniref:Hsp20/alpha crystallin family protein n=1 Tax=Halovivax limisalsi TaxID=1453760 RepID=UPI001FFCA19B|nr:Hsp20/alpha crystallin family protein [Halovivax limisalsi]
MAALRDALRTLPSDVFYDLLEDEGSYLLVIDVPGVSATSVDVSTDDGTLVIEATRDRTHPDDYEYVERNRADDRELRLSLPDGLADPAIETTVERGVLRVQIPKPDETEIDVVEESE